MQKIIKQIDRWLKSLKHKTLPYSQVVRQRNLTPIYAGSNPARVVCNKWLHITLRRMNNMDDNKKEITVVEVFNKLEEVEKQNKEILEKLENMQESNALFHNGFATIFETLRILDEVKQDEDLGDMLKTGSLANVLCAESWVKKHMKTTSKSKVEKEGTVVVKRVREEKAKDVIELLKMLENI